MEQTLPRNMGNGVRWQPHHVHTPRNGKEKLLMDGWLQGGQQQTSTCPGASKGSAYLLQTLKAIKLGCWKVFRPCRRAGRAPDVCNVSFTYIERGHVVQSFHVELIILLLRAYFRIELEMPLSEIAAMPSGMFLILFPGHLHRGDQRQDPCSPAEERALGTLPHSCLDRAVMGTAQGKGPRSSHKYFTEP